MLILAFITHSYPFDASIYIYLFGLPFLISVILIRTEENYEYLLLNSNNYESLPMALN